MYVRYKGKPISFLIYVRVHIIKKTKKDGLKLIPKISRKLNSISPRKLNS